MEVDTDGVVTDADGSISLGSVTPPATPKKKEEEDLGDIRENMDSDTGAMGFFTF